MGPANDAGNSPRATPHSRRDCVSQAGPMEGYRTMKGVIFGGAGGTGRVVVEQGLEKSYEGTAFDRHPQALTIQHPKLSIVQGHIFDPAQAESATVGHEVA